MSNCVPVGTPEDPAVHLTGWGTSATEGPSDKNDEYLRKLAQAMGMDGNELVEQFEEQLKIRYANAVGALMYLAVKTRPDIQHAVSQLAKYVSSPKLDHWLACRRMLRYLKGATKLGLTFHAAINKSEPMYLGPVYADANWAQNVEDRRAVADILIQINGCAVAYTSRTQKSVSL